MTCFHVWCGFDGRYCGECATEQRKRGVMERVLHVLGVVADLVRAEANGDDLHADKYRLDLASMNGDVIAEDRHRLAALASAPAEQETFQNRVQPWLMACFGEMIAGDREERNHRFLEEALELVQACGCTASEAHQLVDYVYGRDVGDPPQEVGGVMVTLAALCLANGLDMHANAETELARIWTKVEAIRAKQAAKPKHSPLPQHVPSAPAGDGVEEMARAIFEADPDVGMTWAAFLKLADREPDFLQNVEHTRRAARAAARTRPHSPLAPTVDAVHHGLGSYSMTFRDEGEDGFSPVEMLRAGCVYIQQGSAQITMSPGVADRLAAALARPRAAVGEREA